MSSVASESDQPSFFARVVDRGWAILASERTTAVLVMVFSIAALIAIVVPQGSDAYDLVHAASAVTLRRLIAWGLTEVFDSDWIYAIGALLVANLSAAIVAGQLEPRDPLGSTPADSEFRREIHAPEPEHAVERLRAAFVSQIGTPAAERVEQSRVTMAFELGGSLRQAALLGHIGLLLLVLAAGIYSSSDTQSGRVPRAKIAVTQSVSNATGVFDMVLGEPFSFFGSTAKFVLRNFVADRFGLGPAIELERINPNEQQGLSFWIYGHAPKGFDARHRSGELKMEAITMGLGPLPGKGIADSPFNVLMVLGMALIAFGALSTRSGAGRLWIECDGDRVLLTGQPRFSGDPDFDKRFTLWALTAEASLAVD